MSLPWKSELRLRLRPGGCQAALVAGGWRPRTLATASAGGRFDQSVVGALETLRGSLQSRGAAAWRTGRRPQARLTVPDENVYYALLDATGAWADQQRQSRHHFSTLLGRGDLAVRTTLLPGGMRWLTAAIEHNDLRDWSAAVERAGARLTQLRPALVEDLAALTRERDLIDAMLVLLRDEGATLVRLDRLRPSAIGWIRYAPRDVNALLRGVHAFALGAPPLRDDAPVVLVPQDHAQHADWADAAERQQWRMHAPLHFDGDAKAAA